MRLALAALACIVATAPAAAQTVMDGSDRGMSPAQRQKFIEAADVISVDPYRVELRRLFVSRNGMLCGEANIPNKQGGYNGYAPFYVNLPRRDGIIAVELPRFPEVAPAMRKKITEQCFR